uniref:Uncharacterized protein n=1 Tax=Cajanus cajan TaxID=3821 RepID=A0A151RKS7_CAJCA|nr:hypothetical protein KK1_035468 [Cajanus cajan]
MEGMVDDLEQQHEEMSEEVNQFKEQMGKILELLQSMESKNRANGESSKQPHETPDYPPGFTPSMQPNPSVQGCTPPVVLTTSENNHHVSTSNLQGQIPLPPYGLPPGYMPPETTNKRKGGETNVVMTTPIRPNEQETDKKTMRKHVDQVAMIKEDDDDNHANFVYLCDPCEELHNWKIVEFPVTLNSISK